MSQNKPLLGIVIFVSVLCVMLVISMVALFSSLNSQIQDKDSQIANLNSQITDLNSQINQINSTGSDQQATIDKLQKVQNLTDQIFLPKPYDSYLGEWAGTWSTVSTFSGSSSQEETSTFQISSPYHLWRIKISLTGSGEMTNLQFRVIQVVGSEEIIAKIFSVTGPNEKETVYLFAETISTNTYYIGFDNFEGTSWSLTIEQLNQ